MFEGMVEVIGNLVCIGGQGRRVFKGEEMFMRG